jgi:hypothetical protein
MKNITAVQIELQTIDVEAISAWFLILGLPSGRSGPYRKEIFFRAKTPRRQERKGNFPYPIANLAPFAPLRGL